MTSRDRRTATIAILPPPRPPESSKSPASRGAGGACRGAQPSRRRRRETARVLQAPCARFSSGAWGHPSGAPSRGLPQLARRRAHAVALRGRRTGRTRRPAGPQPGHPCFLGRDACDGLDGRRPGLGRRLASASRCRLAMPFRDAVMRAMAWTDGVRARRALKRVVLLQRRPPHGSNRHGPLARVKGGAASTRAASRGPGRCEGRVPALSPANFMGGAQGRALGLVANVELEAERKRRSLKETSWLDGRNPRQDPSRLREWRRGKGRGQRRRGARDPVLLWKICRSDCPFAAAARGRPW